MAYLGLGGEGNLKKSRKAFQEALQVRPHWGKALAGEAQTAVVLDPPEQALAVAEKAVKAKGGYRGHLAHGEALLRLGQHTKAVDAFKRCLQRNRSVAEAYLGISKAYELLGLPEKAAEYLAKSEVLSKEGKTGS